MPTSTIRTLYKDFKSAENFTRNYAIDFFSKNRIPTTGIETFDDQELKFYVELVWYYLDVLFQKGRYNETVDESIKYLSVIDSQFGRLESDSDDYFYYYGILFLKGMGTYRLHDFRKSTPIFKKLVEYDPKNENYKMWLTFSKSLERIRICKIITILTLILFLSEILLDKFIPPVIDILLLSLALIGFIGATIYDYYLNRSMRKSELANPPD